MKKYLLLPACAGLLLAACASQPVNKDAEIDALLQSAGIAAQLSALQKPLDTQSLTGNGHVPAELGQAVNGAIGDTLNPSAIRADIKNRISSGMSDSDIQTALAFYQSPAGQHVAAVESGGNGGGDAGAASSELGDIDSATGTSAVISGLAEQSIGTALDLAASGKCKSLGNLPLGGVLGGLIKRAAMSAVRDNVRKAIEHRYQTLGPDDIAAYLQFARSAPGQHFFAARNQAYGAAIASAGQVLAAAIGIQLEQTCYRSGG